MKKLAIVLVCSLMCAIVQAAGVYKITSRVTITGPASYGVLQPGNYTNVYGVAAPTPLGSISLVGDKEFTLSPNGCVGTTSCVATLNLNATLGGDYNTSLNSTSTSSARYTASRASLAVSAHVVGANYTLTPDQSNVSASIGATVPVSFTLSSTGELPLKLTNLVYGNSVDSYGTLYNTGSVRLAATGCPALVAPGTICRVTLSVLVPEIETQISTGYIVVYLQVVGNSKQQAPVSTLLIVNIPN